MYASVIHSNFTFLPNLNDWKIDEWVDLHFTSESTQIHLDRPDRLVKHILLQCHLLANIVLEKFPGSTCEKYGRSQDCSFSWEASWTEFFFKVKSITGINHWTIYKEEQNHDESVFGASMCVKPKWSPSLVPISKQASGISSCSP